MLSVSLPGCGTGSSHAGTREEADLRDGKIQAMKLTGVGFSFLIEVGLFALFGWWCDGKLGWSPWLMVAGMLIGMVFALTQLLKTVERWEAAQKREDDSAEKRP